MGQVAYLGVCLLGCLLFNPTVEGECAENDTVADARGRCPSGALYYKQFCYQFVKSAASWHVAEVTCQSLRPETEAHLASILSPNEGRIVASYLSNQGAKFVWIGLEATSSNGYLAWEWSDGSPLSLPLWDGGSLNTGIDAHQCVSMKNIRKSDSQRDQRGCVDTLWYVCKYRADY